MEVDIRHQNGCGGKEKRQLAPKRAGRWPTSPRIRNQQISRPRGLTNPKLSTRDKKEISDAVTIHPGLSLWYLFALKSHAGQFCSEIGVVHVVASNPAYTNSFFFPTGNASSFFYYEGTTRTHTMQGPIRRNPRCDLSQEAAPNWFSIYLVEDR